MKIFDYLCCLKETLGDEDFCGVVYIYATPTLYVKPISDPVHDYNQHRKNFGTEEIHTTDLPTEKDMINSVTVCLPEEIAPLTNELSFI